MSTKINQTHPGEVLLEDFMKPLKLSAHALSLALRVPASRVAEITRGERAVTAETALRLARYFGTTAEFWIRLQGKYDLAMAQETSASVVKRDVQPRELVHS